MTVRRIVVLLVATVGALTPASTSGATSCSPPRDDSEALAYSDASLDGVPVAWDEAARLLTVDVLATHKGDIDERVVLFTNPPNEEPDGMSIPWEYEIGQAYRIHAHTIEIGLATGGCSGNRPLQTPSATAVEPTQAASEATSLAPEQPGGTGDGLRAWVPLVAAAASLSTFTIVVVRRRRPAAMHVGGTHRSSVPQPGECSVLRRRGLVKHHRADRRPVRQRRGRFEPGFPLV